MRSPSPPRQPWLANIDLVATSSLIWAAAAEAVAPQQIVDETIAGFRREIDRLTALRQ